MTVSLASSGNITTDGTEQTLYSTTTAGTYQLAINLSNMASGDAVRIRIYGKANASDTEAVIYDRSFSNAQGEALKISPPEPATHDWKATIQRTGGVDRSYQWGARLLG